MKKSGPWLILSLLVACDAKQTLDAVSPIAETPTPPAAGERPVVETPPAVPAIPPTEDEAFLADLNTNGPLHLAFESGSYQNGYCSDPMERPSSVVVACPDGLFFFSPAGRLLKVQPPPANTRFSDELLLPNGVIVLQTRNRQSQSYEILTLDDRLAPWREAAEGLGNGLIADKVIHRSSDAIVFATHSGSYLWAYRLLPTGLERIEKWSVAAHAKLPDGNVVFVAHDAEKRPLLHYLDSNGKIRRSVEIETKFPSFYLRGDPSGDVVVKVSSTLGHSSSPRDWDIFVFDAQAKPVHRSEYKKALEPSAASFAGDRLAVLYRDEGLSLPLVAIYDRKNTLIRTEPIAPPYTRNFAGAAWGDYYYAAHDRGLVVLNREGLPINKLETPSYPENRRLRDGRLLVHADHRSRHVLIGRDGRTRWRRSTNVDLNDLVLERPNGELLFDSASGRYAYTEVIDANGQIVRREARIAPRIGELRKTREGRYYSLSPIGLHFYDDELRPVEHVAFRGYAKVFEFPSGAFFVGYHDEARKSRATILWPGGAAHSLYLDTPGSKITKVMPLEADRIAVQIGERLRFWQTQAKGPAFRAINEAATQSWSPFEAHAVGPTRVFWMNHADRNPGWRIFDSAGQPLAHGDFPIRSFSVETVQRDRNGDSFVFIESNETAKRGTWLLRVTPAGQVTTTFHPEVRAFHSPQIFAFPTAGYLLMPSWGSHDFLPLSPGLEFGARWTLELADRSTREAFTSFAESDKFAVLVRRYHDPRTRHFRVYSPDGRLLAEKPLDPTLVDSDVRGFRAEGAGIRLALQDGRRLLFNDEGEIVESHTVDKPEPVAPTESFGEILDCPRLAGTRHLYLCADNVLSYIHPDRVSRPLSRGSPPTP